MDSGDEDLGSSSDELRKCADGPTLRGIDVSKWQETVDWVKVKNSGKTFAFARISDGLNNKDAYFAANWKGMKDVGLVRGAYQFFRPAQDATKQAELVIEAIEANGGLLPGDLPPVLDFETADGVSASTAIARAKTWLSVLEAKYKIKPIVYTGNNMNNVTGSHLSAYKLWVPNYGASCPLMPPGWSNWTFWQDSDTGTVAGVDGPVDMNYFNGDLAALKALTVPEPEPEDDGF
jgi:lysozyme